MSQQHICAFESAGGTGHSELLLFEFASVLSEFYSEFSTAGAFLNSGTTQYNLGMSGPPSRYTHPACDWLICLVM